MKIEKINNESAIFKNIQINNIFFTDYIKELSPEAVKVYIYLLFLAKEKESIKQSEVFKLIGMDIKIFNRAIEELSQSNLIYSTEKGIVIPSLEEKALLYMYSPKIDISEKRLEKMKENTKFADILDAINKQFYCGMMSSQVSHKIQRWFENYNFEPEVLLAVFSEASTKSNGGINYVTKYIDDLIFHKIFTFKDLEQYSERRNEMLFISNFISKKLSLMRNLTTFELEYVEKWLNTYKYNKEIINEALKATINKSNFSIKYIDQILTSWNEKNIRTIEDINKENTEYQKLKNEKKNLVKEKSDKKEEFNKNNSNKAIVNMNKTQEQHDYSSDFENDDI